MQPETSVRLLDWISPRRLGAVYLPPIARPAGERAAFREHLLASAWNGLSGGIVLLTDVILAKTLGAPGWQVTLLATLGPAANLASFYWTGQVTGRPKAGFFLLSGLAGRLPLLLLLAFHTTGWMIALNFVYAVATALVITAGNSVLQARYPEDKRPLYFGLATSVGSAVSIVATQASGQILERHDRAFPWLFAAAGLAGLISVFHMYRMEAAAEGRPGPRDWLRVGLRSVRRRIRPGEAPPPGLRESWRLARRVLRENPGFARFERNYMIYGFAFLSVVPVLPLYVVRELRMDYHQLSATKGIWSQIGLVLLSPPLGMALRRLQPLRFTGRAFLLLALYPLCLLISTVPGIPGPVSWVYAALFFFSLAMAGVNLSWTLGSMHFAGTEDASAFQGVHVGLTGVRGLLAPGLGFALYKLFGSGAVFAFSTAFFTLAGVLMLRQSRAPVVPPRATGAAPLPVPVSSPAVPLPVPVAAAGARPGSDVRSLPVERSGLASVPDRE